MDLCNLNEITALLSRHGFRFQKSKGQNFLIASWVPERIAEETGIDEKYGVLEIGPGIGCLTAQLARRAGRVLALEVDARLMPVLSKTVGDYVNLVVLNQDVMEADLTGLIGEYFGGLTPAVCANLPYNITSPVLTKLIGSGLFEMITVMIQREVARRVCAAPGSADYGAFGIYVNFYYTPRPLFDVSPACFEPRPKVTSSVIKLVKRQMPAADVDEELFFKIVRAAFNQRRKTLSNALSSGFSGKLDKFVVSEAIASCGFPETIRGEALSIQDFARLTDALGRCLA